MALAIKTIRNEFYENVVHQIGIDDFDTVIGKKNYFLGTRIYGDRDKKFILTSEQSEDAFLRGYMVKTPDRAFQTIIGDVFEKTRHHNVYHSRTKIKKRRNYFQQEIREI